MLVGSTRIEKLTKRRSSILVMRPKLDSHVVNMLGPEDPPGAALNGFSVSRHFPISHVT